MNTLTRLVVFLSTAGLLLAVVGCAAHPDPIVDMQGVAKGAVTATDGRFSVQTTEFDAAEAEQRSATAPETVLRAMQAGRRQSGQGPYAEMLAARFTKATRQFGFESEAYPQALDCRRFLHPAQHQLGLGF